MAITPLTPNEDQIFKTLWLWMQSLTGTWVNGVDTARVFKGFQNLTTTPVDGTGAGGTLSTYAALVPGVMVRQDQQLRTYDIPNQQVLITRGTTYSYQVDCYGPFAADWANEIAIAWNSGTAADWFAGIYPATPAVLPVPGAMAPLYADEPQQLDIVNGELEFEQRYMLRLYVHVNQQIGMPQDTMLLPVKTDTWPVTINTPGDLLPP